MVVNVTVFIYVYHLDHVVFRCLHRCVLFPVPTRGSQTGLALHPMLQPMWTLQNTSEEHNQIILHHYLKDLKIIRYYLWLRIWTVRDYYACGTSSYSIGWLVPEVINCCIFLRLLLLRYSARLVLLPCATSRGTSLIISFVDLLNKIGFLWFVEKLLLTRLNSTW